MAFGGLRAGCAGRCRSEPGATLAGASLPWRPSADVPAISKRQKGRVKPDLRVRLARPAESEEKGGGRWAGYPARLA